MEGVKKGGMKGGSMNEGERAPQGGMKGERRWGTCIQNWEHMGHAIYCGSFTPELREWANGRDKDRGNQCDLLT